MNGYFDVVGFVEKMECGGSYYDGYDFLDSSEKPPEPIFNPSNPPKVNPDPDLKVDDEEEDE